MTDSALGSAVISEDKQYRYFLSRYCGASRSNKSICFVMLNPSKADAFTDDNTIRRCRGFAQTWGYQNLFVVNLFAYRATSPTDLWRAEDPVGPGNDIWLRRTRSASYPVVCAWGYQPKAVDRIRQVASLLPLDQPDRLLCLGTTRDGSPKHPLRLSKALQPVPYDLAGFLEAPVGLART